MKTSKIILSSFIAVIVVSLLSFMITVDGKNNNKYEDIEETLTHCNYIRVCKDARVEILSNDSSNIKYSHLKDSAAYCPYEIKADTLILKALKQNDHNLYYSVNTKGLKSIINKGGDVSVDLQQDSLHIINTTESRFNIKEKSSINYLQLEVNEESRVNIYSSDIKELVLDVNNSDIYIQNHVSVINLVAKNKADIRLQSSNKLVAICDSSSRYRVY